MDAYWITWFPGSLLAFFGVIALCWKGIRSLVRIQEALPVLYEIHHEFSPNSGHSLRDQVDGIRSEQSRVKEELVDGNSRVQKISDNLEVYNRRMLQHIEDDANAFRRIEGKLRP